MCKQTDHYPLNTKFLEKKFFNPKTLINFRNSLKISLSQDAVAPTTNKRICHGHNVPPMANRVKKKKMKLLTNRQQKSYENAKICYIYTEKFENKYIKDKKYCKVRGHCHYISEYSGAAHVICNLEVYGT